PMASRSVPSASGLAGLLKPIWLSLICAKVKAEASAASASPSRPKDFGTPPDSVHKTPVPAQIMHSSVPLRSISGPPFSQSLLFVMTLSINRLLPRFGLELNHQERPQIETA